MLRRSACLSLAAAAALASAGWVHAAEPTALDLNQPLYAVDQTPPRRPLMAMMDKMGMASQMDNAGLSITGFAEGSWTYNFDKPNNQLNVGRVFDFEDQDATLNQVELMISRSV